jgi:hypothetical protein
VAAGADEGVAGVPAQLVGVIEADGPGAVDLAAVDAALAARVDATLIAAAGADGQDYGKTAGVVLRVATELERFARVF